MAMRRLPRELFQHVSRNHLLRKQFLQNETSHQLAPFFNVIYQRYTNVPRGILMRGIQTQSESCMEEGIKAADNADGRNSNAGFPSSAAFSYLKADDAQDVVQSSATSMMKPSSRHDLAMMFTCTVCETRSVKTCCRESYEKGVVVVRCGGCNNLHLMADRLGWFGEPGSVEDLLAARGDIVKKGSIDSDDLTVEDVAGKKL